MISLFGINKSQNNITDNNITDIKEEKIIFNRTPKKKIEIENHIKDLENTLKINQDYIYNIILVSPINQKNKKKLIDTLDRIKLLFNEKKQYRKDSVNISSKILINKQIIEEMKRRIKENIIYQNDKLSNYRESVNKKGFLVKNFIKKFNELEIFIQRVSKLPENIEKYGNLRNFTVVPFMKKNEYLLKKLKFYQIKNAHKENKLKELTSDTNFLKQNKAVSINFKDNNIYANKYNNFNIIKNYYINLIDLRQKEIELIKCWNNLIIGDKYNERKRLINDTIFERKMSNNKNENNIFENDEDELRNKNKDNKGKNIENDFLFVINEIEDKDFKELANQNNYWIDSEPEDL